MQHEVARGAHENRSILLRAATTVTHGARHAAIRLAHTRSCTAHIIMQIAYKNIYIYILIYMGSIWFTLCVVERSRSTAVMRCVVTKFTAMLQIKS